MPAQDKPLQSANLLQHFQEVSRLALIGDYDRLADYVAEAVNDLTKASVAFWMIDERENILRIRASRGLSREHVENAILPVESGSSITSIGLRDGRPVFRKDILDETQEPRFYNLEEARKQGWRSFLSVPLLGQGKQPLGALSIYGIEPRDFSEATQSLLSTFANHAAIAFENVQVMQRLDTQLESLHQITQKQDLKEVLDQTLSGISTILGRGTSSIISLYNKTSDSWQIQSYFGPLKDILQFPPRPDGTGRHVLKTKKPIYLGQLHLSSQELEQVVLIPPRFEAFVFDATLDGLFLF